MKMATLKLCLPVAAMTAQQNAAQFIIPPFLDDLKYPVSAIGTLVSLAPVFALVARVPSGIAYNRERARWLLMAAISTMALCNFLYGFTVRPFEFAVIHALNGFAYGAATTIYLAFYVDALPPDEDRHHAMGYYAGCLAIGYSTGGFLAGYIADRLSYAATFNFSGILALACVALLFFLKVPASAVGTSGSLRVTTPQTFVGSLKNLLNPKLAGIVVVALFLNLMHQMGNVFLPLYGLAVGISLTKVGVIKGLYAMCNAITRPLSGMAVKRFSQRNLAVVTLPLQALFLTLVPLFHGFGPVLTLFVISGFMRAVAIVSNTIGMVEDVDETKVSRGVASGLFNAAGDVGNIIGPSLGGLIAAFTGIERLFFFGPVMVIAMFFASLWSCKFISRTRAAS
jgi:predicted MFS family arabinose efflux permease